MPRIAAIGVMPAIASCENDQEKATAPARRPSIQTGEPLMPATTPVRSRSWPVSRARM